MITIDHDGHRMVLVAGDYSRCLACGREWDTNDPAPPPCVELGEEQPVPKRLTLIYVGVWLLVLVGIAGIALSHML